MKRVLLLLAGVLAAVLLAGCAVNQASLEGHDFIDTAVANVRIGVDEYHADDLERMRTVRASLAAAFAADVVTLAADEDKVKVKVAKFLAYLDKAEVAESVERKRHRNLLNSLRALSEVNDALRDLTQIKLGWKSEIVEYVGKLRKAVENERKD